MSSVLDALPLVVPFFGVLFSSFTVLTCCMNRRINQLSNRVEQLEQTRNPLPQFVIQSAEQNPQPPFSAPPPPNIVSPPMYPMQYPYYNPRPSAPPAFYNGMEPGNPSSI